MSRPGSCRRERGSPTRDADDRLRRRRERVEVGTVEERPLGEPRVGQQEFELRLRNHTHLERHRLDDVPGLVVGVGERVRDGQVEFVREFDRHVEVVPPAVVGEGPGRRRPVALVAEGVDVGEVDPEDELAVLAERLGGVPEHGALVGEGGDVADDVERRDDDVEVDLEDGRERRDVRLDDSRVEPPVGGFAPEDGEHRRGEVDAVRVDASREQVEGDLARPAAEFEDRVGVATVVDEERAVGSVHRQRVVVEAGPGVERDVGHHSRDVGTMDSRFRGQPKFSTLGSPSYPSSASASAARSTKSAKP